MSFLRKDESSRLVRIAEQLDAEADTWGDGWGYMQDGVLTFSKEDEWAFVRYTKLRKSAEFLRSLSAALLKRDIAPPAKPDATAQNNTKP